MPYIDSKITVKLNEENRKALSKKLGEAISILNKPESYLMLGFDDEYSLYFSGKEMVAGAYISVSLFGEVNPKACEKFTAELCKIYYDILGIPADKIYVTYHGVKDWGWNGANF